MLKFTKMHGLGNDFIVIDAINQSVVLNQRIITTLANRHTGIGFDQCLLVEKSAIPNIDFYYRIFNADGTEIGQCGNGARCLARFVAHYGLTSKKTINLATKTTVIKAHLNQDQSVTLDMGLPNWQPRLIPLAVSQQQDFYTLTLADNTPLKFHALSLGNPHAVTIVVDVDTIQIDKLGVEISEHILFPQQTNAGFMQLIDESNIKLRVYERGCGETMACGSGAVAAVAVGMKFYSLGKCIQVHVPGGELIVELSGTNNSLLLTGSAVFVYEGELFT